MKRCLSCYQPLPDEITDFHPACSRKLFGRPVPPLLPYTEAEMEALATQIVRSQVAVTGVQPKISLDLPPASAGDASRRFTIVGLWGAYILKPPTGSYPQLPEVESLTMHLARLAGIRTVPHCLIRLQSGELAYLTKRIDRTPKGKVHMEDMCQLTERLTEDKYHGSYEQIAKTLLKYSTNPGLDVVNFFEQVLFSFLTGNADMHLKNFSMLHLSPQETELAPAYDLVATVLVNPADDEDLALTLNGRKKKIHRRDFEAAFQTLHLDRRQQENLFRKMERAKEKWLAFIEISFLTDDFKAAYRTLIQKRFERLTIH